jgi:hypothetical protein
MADYDHNVMKYLGAPLDMADYDHNVIKYLLGKGATFGSDKVIGRI